MSLCSLWGTSLKNTAYIFRTASLKKALYPACYLTEGFSYGPAHDNQLIPFVRFKRGQSMVVDRK